MDEDNDFKKYLDISITGVVISVFSLIITFFLLVIIFKSKAFTYSFYYIIILNILLLLDNVFRIAPFDDNNKKEFNIFEKIQAYGLIVVNKFEISVITMQNLIYYLGITKTKSYESNEKCIFFMTLLICLLISTSIGVIFFFKVSLKAFRVYCYIDTNMFSTIIDSIFHSVFYLANLFFLLNIIIYLCCKRKEIDLDFKHYLCKTIILFILITFLFFHSYFSNIYELRESYFDIFYLIDAFILDLIFCLNRRLAEETLKIFCRNTYKEKYNKIKKWKIFPDYTLYEDCEDNDDDNEDSEKTEMPRKTNFENL